MRLLVDTNILIPLEPTSPADIEPTTPYAASLVELASRGGDQVVIHPGSTVDLGRDSDDIRRTMRTTLLAKYVVLTRPPNTGRVERVLGPAVAGTNDAVDNALLAAVEADAVEYLVTQDAGIHRKARRLGVANRVLTLEDALSHLRTLHDSAPAPPPSVEFGPVHEMNESDHIFDSLRDDYEGFDQWLVRCKRLGREGWRITAPDGSYAAVAILKPKDDEFSLGGRVAKLCTMKVAAEHQGNRYGELLLKAVFGYCAENSYDHVWVTVFEKHVSLIALLSDFGFYRLDGTTTTLGEAVYTKTFSYTEAERQSLPRLEFHIRFGPPALRFEADHAFVVPIEPRYHEILFPDAQVQPQLATVPRPFGNALRKAYLCHSPTRRLGPGDTIAFYRSRDLQHIDVLGAVEETIVSSDPREILSVVGQRTVYSADEIHRLAARDVLVILFRQDRILPRPIRLDELKQAGALARAPQSIVGLKREGVEWMARQLGE